MTQEQVRQSLQFAIWRLESQFTWNNDTVSQTLMDLANQMGIKLRDFMPTFLLQLLAQQVQHQLCSQWLRLALT